MNDFSTHHGQDTIRAHHTPILSQSDNLDKTRFGAVGVPGENPHRHGKNVQTPHTVALVGSALFSKL